MRTEMTLSLLVSELQSNCGDMLSACQRVGVSLIFVNQWRKDDKIIDEQLREAERVGVQGLVSEAIRRAVHGTEKGVYYKGAKVDTELQYSDGLLQTLLKAKIPEFAKDAEGSNVHLNVNIANVMPRATNYDEWLSMKQATLAPPPEALPAPDPQVVDAEFAEIEPLFGGISL